MASEDENKALEEIEKEEGEAWEQGPHESHTSPLIILVRTFPRLLGIGRKLPALLRYAKGAAPRFFGRVAPELLVSKRAVQATELAMIGETLSHQWLVNAAVNALTWAYISSDTYLAVRDIPGLHLPGIKEDPAGQLRGSPPWRDIGVTVVDKMLFHALATIYLPTWFLDAVHKTASAASQSGWLGPLQRHPRARLLFPSIVTACMIPLVVGPITDATNYAMDRTLRRCYMSKTQEVSLY